MGGLTRRGASPRQVGRPWHPRVKARVAAEVCTGFIGSLERGIWVFSLSEKGLFPGKLMEKKDKNKNGHLVGQRQKMTGKVKT